MATKHESIDQYEIVRQRHLEEYERMDQILYPGKFLDESIFDYSVRYWDEGLWKYEKMEVTGGD